MTAVVQARRRWPTRLRTAASTAGPVVGLLAAVTAVSWCGYWLLTNAGRPASIIGLLVAVAPLYAACLWLIQRDAVTRQRSDDAVEVADRSFAAVLGNDDDAPSIGRHAKKGVAR